MTTPTTPDTPTPTPTPCAYCNGHKTIDGSPCPECRGTGEDTVECLRCLTRLRPEDAVVVPELAPMRFCAACAVRVRVSIGESV